ncbi:indole-3-glycerol phosphate synthase TrpC [Sporolactobacillus terrae]|uniref:indole-3-glycerol phosphate synthase TrpC n=1 Tax=Sporolactobacillus terrae TaxID=269673 RepID=UPI00111A4C48|nr:indole-3-glycerol phosphate synthase TrpC [Sporolactobacillus terrae]
MPESILDQILKTKKEELAHFSLPEPMSQPKPHYSLKDALLRPNHQLGLIAEVKHASPSKGIFRTKISAKKTATRYASAGADAISILTDRNYFHGSINDLIEVRQSVQLPILRKDFIIDERQIEESARIGADAVLLIAAALEPTALHELYLAAKARGLEALVEVHDAQELASLLNGFTPEIIGVNNRDLRTFHTNLHVTAALAPNIPRNAVLISESGVHRPQDVQFLLEQGTHAALVGEALICAADPKQKICDLFGKGVNAHVSRT